MSKQIEYIFDITILSENTIKQILNELVEKKYYISYLNIIQNENLMKYIDLNFLSESLDRLGIDYTDDDKYIHFLNWTNFPNWYKYNRYVIDIISLWDFVTEKFKFNDDILFDFADSIDWHYIKEEYGDLDDIHDLGENFFHKYARSKIM